MANYNIAKHLHFGPEGKDTRGAKNRSAKLHEDQVRAIRASPESAYRLAKLYGITHTHAWRIKTGKVWKHLSD